MGELTILMRQPASPTSVQEAAGQGPRDGLTPPLHLSSFPGLMPLPLLPRGSSASKLAPRISDLTCSALQPPSRRSHQSSVLCTGGPALPWSPA